MAKDRTPAEIKAARRRKERKRLLIGLGFWLLWVLLFTIGATIRSQALMWASFGAISIELTFVYGLHEKALRKLAGRPEVNYRALHELEKAERKSRPEELKAKEGNGTENRPA